ncbi:Aluminum-activated malate transporter 9 [Ancistrocladus abbreviatus]
MASQLGSFRCSLAEKRERERLLSSKLYSHLGVSILEEETEKQRSCCSFHNLSERFTNLWIWLREFIVKALEMGKSDPRKIIFAAKMGLALMLISLLIFLKEPFEAISRHSVWAILTVVVVFEFSIGATLSKGFNRGLGTLSAGGLALGMAVLSTLAGDLEEVVVICSIFIIGFFATYLKLQPTMKPYEYGFRVFLLTYCFIMVSGYRTGEFIHTAVTRFLLIALGASVGLVINTCIYPIWAGEDLHNLVVKNFMNVADSLEGCVDGYLNCIAYERVPSKILTYQASDDPLYRGYRSAVESTSQEDALLGFAIWEPPHGPYKMLRYPWKSYTKVSGALRHCAFTVMALHGGILSEIQAPPERRQVFRDELQRVGNEGAKVLRELGNKIKRMEKLGPGDILEQIHEAAEELQRKVDRKSYLLVNSGCWEIGRPNNLGQMEDLLIMDDDENAIPEVKSLSQTISLPTSEHWNISGCLSTTTAVPSESRIKKQISWPAPPSFDADADPEESSTYENASALSLATFVSLLMEFVARIQNVVDSFEELSEKAKFKDCTPVGQTSKTEMGIWNRLWRCLRS